MKEVYYIIFSTSGNVSFYDKCTEYINFLKEARKLRSQQCLLTEKEIDETIKEIQSFKDGELKEYTRACSGT